MARERFVYYGENFTVRGPLYAVGGSRLADFETLEDALAIVRKLVEDEGAAALEFLKLFEEDTTDDDATRLIGSGLDLEKVALHRAA